MPFKLHIILHDIKRIDGVQMNLKEQADDIKN